jgi:hypothetical protein
MQTPKLLVCAVASSVLALSLSAQEIATTKVDDAFAPVASSSHSPQVVVADQPVEHKFFDRQQMLALYAHSGMRVVDTVKTCRELSHGGREDWIPTQSCGGIAAWQVGSVGLALAIGWMFHKHGNHRLERITPWVGTTASAAGWTKSVFNIR